MAFNVYEVIRVACLSNHSNDFVNAKKPLFITFYSACTNRETKFAFAMKSFGDFIVTVGLGLGLGLGVRVRIRVRVRVRVRVRPSCQTLM